MKFKSKRNIVKAKKIMIELLKMVVGTALMAFGIELFLVPNQLSTGGFSGIATIIYYIANIPVGTTMFLLNIPLFFIAYFKVGKKFFTKAIFGTWFLSIFLNAFQGISPITEDRFLAFLYGSTIVGIGTAIVLKSNGSTGGTDLLASVIRTFRPHYKTGTLIVVIDTIIVIISTIFFRDMEVGLYSALAIYVMGKILDMFLEGINFAKKVLIISDKWEEISEVINKELNRGVTALDAMGMYKKQKRKILLCVMSRNEIGEARRVIHEIDPNAFMVITNAREVYGEGFKE